MLEGRVLQPPRKPSATDQRVLEQDLGALIPNWGQILINSALLGFERRLLMGRLFLCCFVICIREGFAPERVARLEYGGFLMLGYQKSSAAAPKPPNWFWFGIFLAVVFALAGASCRQTVQLVIAAMLVRQ